MAVTEPQVQAAFDATDGVVPPSAARAILVEKLTPLFNGGDPSVILGPDLSAIQDLAGFGVPRRVADGVWSILPVDAAGGVPLLDASGLIKRSQLSEVTLSGVVGSSLPELIRDGVAGTVTMPSVVVQGFNNAHYQGIPMRYTTAETTLSVPEGAQYFVACVIANDSTSSVQLVLKPQLSLSNCIPLYSVSRIGTQIHAIGFDTMGCGLPQKQETALLETQPYRRSTAGGLMISEDATRHVLLTPARAYAGTTPVELLAFDSNTDRLVECYHAGGAWAYSAVAQYDNSSIDNGTNKVAMGLNKWMAVWFFRSVGDDKEVFYVLGTEEYNTEAAAQVSQRPAIPDAIAWHVIFVGRSIIQNGAPVGDMQSAFVDAFSVAQISDHNLLSGLQGGAAGDYQHLTAAQVSAFAAKEPSLGNPSVSGRILSSTTAGVRSWVTPYALPTASASVLGGVKVGTGLAIASGVLSVAYGSSAGTACQGNDSRLSDARAPTAHTHPATDISGILSVNLTGFSVGINESINSSMTILAAFGAAQGQINARLTTVTADAASRAANTVYAAPNGSAGTATFRSLVPADIPNLDAAKLTSGTLGYARGGTGISAPGATAGNLRWSGSAFAIDTASYLTTAGTAAAATKLATARTLTIGATGKAFNGTANVAWTLAEIGAQAVLTNPVTGTGVSGRVAVWDSASSVSHSANLAYDGTALIVAGFGHMRSWTGAPTTYAGLYPISVSPGNDNFALLWAHTGITTYLNATSKIHLQIFDGAERNSEIVIATNSVVVRSLAASQMVATDAANKLVSLDAATVRSTIGAVAASDVKEIYNWYSYSSRPADCNLAPNGNGGIRSFKATGSMTANKPPQGDSHIIHLGWDSQTPGWDSQLSVKPETGAIQMRGQNAGVWSAWRTVWDSVNLTNLNQLTNGPGYVTAAHNHDSAYLGISATAAAATKLTTARTLTIGGTGKAFDGTANVSWSLAEIGAQAVLGYTPVNKGGDTMAGDLSMPYNYSYRANDSLGRATTLIGDNQINLRLNNSSTVGWFARIRSSSVLGYTLTVDCPDNTFNGGICNLQVTGAVQALSVAVTGNIACAFVSVTGSDIYTLPTPDPVGTIRFINGSAASADNPKIIAPSGSYLRYTLPDGSYHNDTTAVSIWRRHIMVQKIYSDVWWVVGTLA